MSELITAQQAFNEYTKNAKVRISSDISKMNTIMKNIKNRAEKGFNYLDYHATISYAMAKTLTELGYKMYKFSTDTMPMKTLEDFKGKGLYRIRIDWSSNE